MEINVNEFKARVPVAILHLQGELDASTYLDVIARVKEIFTSGTRHLLIDMSELSFMSSSGLVALHSAALTMEGKPLPDPEYGWNTFHTIGKDLENGSVENCKILNPQPAVSRSLQVTGFDKFLEIFTDLDEALASF